MLKPICSAREGIGEVDLLLKGRRCLQLGGERWTRDHGGQWSPCGLCPVRDRADLAAPTAADVDRHLEGDRAVVGEPSGATVDRLAEPRGMIAREQRRLDTDHLLKTEALP